MKRADTPTARPPAEERCTCGRLLVMGLPCAHHVDDGDILAQARFTVLALDGAGHRAAARVVGEMVGALSYQRALVRALHDVVSPEDYQRAEQLAARSSR